MIKRGIFYLLCGWQLAAAQSDLFDAANSRQFADYLYRSGNYAFAAREYERVLFLQPANDSVAIAMIGAYRKAGDFQRVHAWVRATYGNKPLPKTVAWEYGKMLALQPSSLQATQWLRAQRILPQQDSLQLALAISLQNRQWRTADTLCKRLKNTTVANLYAPIIAEGVAIRTKKPALATALGIIPGAGKIYTHQWKDGVLAVVMMGGMAWQAYRGFDASGLRSARGWTFAALGTGFYAGSIYGSYTAALRWNESRQTTVVQKAKAAIQRAF